MTSRHQQAYPLPGESGGMGRNPGLSKLELYAAMALQGMMASDTFAGAGPEDAAAKAVEYGKALAAKLDAELNPPAKR